MSCLWMRFLQFEGSCIVRRKSSESARASGGVGGRRR